MTRTLLILLLLPLLPARGAGAADQTPDFGPAVVLALPNRAAPPEPLELLRVHPRVLVVQDDPGGPLRPRLKLVAQLRATHTRVELRGRFCNSACTLLLGAGDVCVAPQTVFGFHGPRYFRQPMPAERFELWSRRMADHYPAALRRWFMAQARHAGAVPLTLTGRQLIAIGLARC